MADQTTEITISVPEPDRITVGMWETFTTGRQAYIKQQDDAKKIASGAITDYYGALACIAAGFVHVKGPDAFMQYLKATDHSATPLAVVGLINREISRRMAAALDTDPLGLTLKPGSSGTSTPQP